MTDSTRVSMICNIKPHIQNRNRPARKRDLEDMQRSRRELCWKCLWHVRRNHRDWIRQQGQPALFVEYFAKAPLSAPTFAHADLLGSTSTHAAARGASKLG